MRRSFRTSMIPTPAQNNTQKVPQGKLELLQLMPVTASLQSITSFVVTLSMIECPFVRVGRTGLRESRTTSSLRNGCHATPPCTLVFGATLPFRTVMANERASAVGITAETAQDQRSPGWGKSEQGQAAVGTRTADPFGLFPVQRIAFPRPASGRVNLNEDSVNF